MARVKTTKRQLIFTKIKDLPPSLERECIGYLKNDEKLKSLQEQVADLKYTLELKEYDITTLNEAINQLAEENNDLRIQRDNANNLLNSIYELASSVDDGLELIETYEV